VTLFAGKQANIKGNDYRLVVATDFAKGIVWIKWIGTHLGRSTDSAEPKNRGVNRA
jgi:mRNA interferase HigB